MNGATTISCICPVYGGVAWLEQALECFLRQDWPHKELVIVNSFPEQWLEFTAQFSQVRIINLGVRPPSLGALRNICVEEARGEFIVIFDSDDLFLANHLSNFVPHFRHGADWVWLTPQFWVLDEEIKDIVPGACPLFAYSKGAWERAGKYPDLTVGEDAKLIAAITQNEKGRKVELPLDKISFLYRWGQGSHHVSGEGADRPGVRPAHDRAHDALMERISRGHEKIGRIVLKPNNPLDWKFKVDQFLSRHVANDSKKNSIALVELGRFGDICNVLPIARHIAENYGKPHFVVSKEFASILDGCSYVEPFPVDLKNNQLNEALAIAQREFRFVINCQIWGENFEIVKVCASYNRESWRMAGFGNRFDDPNWKPVFDRRDYEREKTLWDKLNNGKPMILVNVRSLSSPFPDGNNLLSIIRSGWGETCNIVDISTLILPHIIDVVGLIERAALVISVDTSTLHFAAATGTPVIAIVNDKEWLGTEPRCWYLARLKYNEVMRPEMIKALITHGLSQQRLAREIPVIKPAPTRTIFHVVEKHEETNPKEQVRKAEAQKSWDVLYQDGVRPAHLWHYPRNALTIGDVRPLPFLKDVLEFGMRQATDDDIIMWTNDDNFLHPDIADLLRFHVSVWGACTSQRVELRNVSFPTTYKKADVWRQLDSGHMGRDLFAATKRWLKEHWEEIPDFILGASDFDLCLACLVRLHHGIAATRANIEPTLWPAEIERGYVAHQYHHPRWRDPGNIHQGAAQQWNRRLFQAWARNRLPDLKFNADGCI